MSDGLDAELIYDMIFKNPLDETPILTNEDIGDPVSKAFCEVAMLKGDHGWDWSAAIPEVSPSQTGQANADAAMSKRAPDGAPKGLRWEYRKIGVDTWAYGYNERGEQQSVRLVRAETEPPEHGEHDEQDEEESENEEDEEQKVLRY